MKGLLDENMINLRKYSDGQSSVIRTWKIFFDFVKAQIPRAAEILSSISVLDA
jgi:hypothetical protein